MERLETYAKEGARAMREGARGIQSIEVSGRILRALADGCEPMMLKQLAHAADLVPAQCHAYLTSLRHVGLVHQDPLTGLYRTGPFALRLGIGWLKSTPIASAAISDLKILTNELGAMTLLAVWGTVGPTIVHSNMGATRTGLNLRQGTSFSVTGTATGRVFAAFGNATDLEQRIAADLKQSGRSGAIGKAMTRSEFERQLDATRTHGYATEEGAPIPGINAVSAPIFDHDGSLSCVATLIGPNDILPVTKGAIPVEKLLAVTKPLSGDRYEPDPALSSATGGELGPAVAVSAANKA